jgi:hypothetical protein
MHENTGASGWAGYYLPPNPSLPYVVVVADSNGLVQEAPDSVNTAYFQKYLLGVLVQGYDPVGFFDPTEPDWVIGLASDLNKYSGRPSLR